MKRESPYPYQIINHYLVDLNFSTVKDYPYESLTRKAFYRVETAIDVKHFDKTIYRITLKNAVKLFHDTKPDEEGGFDELFATAYCSYSAMLNFHIENVEDIALVDEEERSVYEAMIEPCLETEIAAFLYPFNRHQLITLIQQAGFPSIRLDPIDFEAVYAQKVQARQM